MNDSISLEALRVRIFDGFDAASSSDPRSLDKSFRRLVDKIGLEEVPLRQILEGPPEIVNFHFHCRVVQKCPSGDGTGGAHGSSSSSSSSSSSGECVTSGQEATANAQVCSPRMIFPLEAMQSELAGLLYVAPSLKIQLGKGAPNATFSKRGYVTLVGGGCSDSFREHLVQACYMVLSALRCICPSQEFTVDEFRINHKVASVKAKGRFFLARLHDELRAHNFQTKIGKGIGFLYVKKVFGEADNRVTFCICASGKMNIVSFRYDYQAIGALRLISPFLKRNLVPLPAATTTTTTALRVV